MGLSLPVGAVVDIAEWDGSRHTVRVVRAGGTCRSIEYCDGVVHDVEQDHLLGELQARGHRFMFAQRGTVHELPYFHTSGCTCANVWGYLRG